MSSSFLLEIGTEEIPASYLAPYAQQLERLLSEELQKADLAAEGFRTAYTPRRLMLFCAALATEQPVKEEDVKGPPVDVAYKDGAPTRAAEAFAQKTGVALAALERRAAGGKEYLYAHVTRGGGEAGELLPGIVGSVIRRLKSPKSMRWDDKPTVFARPIRWLVALHGTEVIGVDLDGLQAGRVTYGHRFLAPEPIELAAADFGAYSQALEDAHVMLEMTAREHEIARQLQAHGAQEQKIDRGLMRTCANLVEWPSVVRGTFDESLLELPEPVLVTALKTHQKSFCAYNDDGSIAAGFLSVANNDLADEERIRRGYERVVIARLADAKFFWDEDCRETLAARVEKLGTMTFQEQLGSYYDKTTRVQALARRIAEATGQADQAPVVERAALLSRADLTTAMVFEFPELQGVMGRIYAGVVDGEAEEVCLAIEEMYQPRGADDALPASVPGALLSVADRLDSLAGCCAVGFAPTGSADPYALRRQALGLLRTIVRHELSFPLAELVAAACELQPVACGAEVRAQVLQILHGRLETVLRDAGVRYDLINAVTASNCDDVAAVADIAAKLMALVDTEAFRKACTVVERCHNISRAVELEDTEVDEALFAEDGERIMWQAWQRAADSCRHAAAARDVAAWVAAVAGEFHDELHQYFDTVRVNASDERLRLNRLKAVRAIRDALVADVADLSRVVFEGEQE
jgi:glycyl-tRNA synthetase beta chain